MRDATEHDDARIDIARDLVEELLDRPDVWLPRVRFDAGKRWYERIVHAPDHEIWLLSWLPDESTGFHDHGHSAGAFAVALGSLEERERVDECTVSRALGPGDVRTFGPSYIHEVVNAFAAPAVSLHAYTPPLETMNRYEIAGSRASLVAAERRVDW
jgi:predicted metal-dependent enzyme (double-stranded beta helix superfamily)